MELANASEWERVSLIGKGAFGRVYSAYLKDDPEKSLHAIKVSISHGHSNNLLIAEIDIHSRLTHPDIVRYVNSYDLKECGGISLEKAPEGQGKCVAMVLEFLAGKDLRAILKDGDRLKRRQVQKLAKNMVSALLYLKEQGIVHRDVKPDNIFIDANGRYKLGDFGLAIKVENAISKGPIVGSPMYMAPELLLSTGKPSSASDMWSLGIVIFEMYHGDPPWNAKVLTKLKEEVDEVDKTGVSREDLGPEPEPIRDFIDSTVVKDPNVRLSVEKAIGHPLLQIAKSRPTSDEGFLRDLREFGKGTRTDFFLALHNKYPDHPVSFNEFTEKYDRLYVLANQEYE